MHYALYAMGLSLVESLTHFIIQCVYFAWSGEGLMVRKGFTLGQQLVPNIAGLFYISFLILFFRFIFLNQIINAVVHYWVSRTDKSGMDLKKSLSINIGCGVLTLIVTLIVLNPVTQQYLSGSGFQQLLFYGTELGCIISPFVLYYLGWVPYEKRGELSETSSNSKSIINAD
jgi:hypothetical protein